MSDLRRRFNSGLRAIANSLVRSFKRLFKLLGSPFEIVWDFLQLGRIFRRLGLPLWTLIGVGAAGWWFDNAGVLIETSIKQILGTESGGFAAYTAPLVLFFIPWIFILAIAAWNRTRSFSEQMQSPEGKKGIILLVSRPESALYSIRYHFVEKETLEFIWLLPSRDAEEEFGDSSLPQAQKIKEECQKLSQQCDRPLIVTIENGVSPADSQDTFDRVNRIFRRYRGNPNEIVADFTGGTKPMTVGMIMACLPSDRDLEYVAFNPKTKTMSGPFLIDYQHRVFDLVE